MARCGWTSTLLRSAPVQGGYVMWQTDITELVENMERLKENRTELAERNYLEQQNYEAERKTNALREKNRLYDLLQRRLAPDHPDGSASDPVPHGPGGRQAAAAGAGGGAGRLPETGPT